MHTIDMNEDVFAKHFSDTVWHTEHTVFDLNCVGKHALSMLPRDRGFKVILTGEGADELFGGYSWLLPDFLLEPDTSMPDLPLYQNMEAYERIRDKSMADVKSSLTATGTAWSVPNEKPLDDEIKRAFNGIDQTRLIFAKAFEWHMFDPKIRYLAAPNYRLTETVKKYWPEGTAGKIEKEWHPLHSGLYAWCKKELPNILLTSLGDRSEMAHSLEGRPPFLDHKLAELMFSIPPSLKVHFNGAGDSDETHANFREKWILREAVKPFISEEIYKRRKHPYVAPMIFKKEGKLHQMFEEILSRENVQGTGFLCYETLKTDLDRGFGEGADTSSFRRVLSAGSLVVLGLRFGVKKTSLDDINQTARVS